MLQNPLTGRCQGNRSGEASGGLGPVSEHVMWEGLRSVATAALAFQADDAEPAPLKFTYSFKPRSRPLRSVHMLKLPEYEVRKPDTHQTPRTSRQREP